MLVDRQKSEFQNLLDHINQSLSSSDIPIEPHEISFDRPRVIPSITPDTVNKSKPNDSYIYNTIIKVIPSSQYDYEDPIDIEYRRIDLDTQYQIVSGDREIEIDKKRSELSKKDIKGLLCDLCRFRDDSLEIDLFDTVKANEQRIVLYPIEHSLLYIGQIERIITYIPEDGRIRFSDIINSTPLDGLEYETL